MKVVNTRTHTYHIVEEKLGKDKFKTACGLTVKASKQYTGEERWIQEIDAWVCNCSRCLARSE